MTHTKRDLIAAFLVVLCVCFAGQAQRPSEVVKWSVNITGETSNTASATLTATIMDGWHVYAISQPSGGPTPLKISIPAGNVFTLEGPVAETKVTRHLDPNFNMEAIYYLKSASFNLSLKATGTATIDTLPLDVRFQACSERLCLPPYTTHLTAALKRR